MSNNMVELEWTPIFGASKYEITRCGKVRLTATKKMLAIQKDRRGYMSVNLALDDGNRKHRKLHQILALTYIPNPNEHKEIDHIDRNPSNNSLANIRWASRMDQAKNRSYNSSTLLSSRPVWQLSKEGERLQRFDSTKEAERSTGLKNIRNAVIKRKHIRPSGNIYIVNTAGGFRWEFCDKSSQLYPDEEWKCIPSSFANSVGIMVSNMGRFKYKNGHIIDSNRVRPHYVIVNIGGQQYAAHRVVCETFSPNDDPETKTVCNHKDGNMHNNRTYNLEWCSRSDNTKHAYMIGLCSNTKKVEQLNRDGQLIKVHNSVKECSEDVRISLSTIRKLLKGMKSEVTTDQFRYYTESNSDE